MTGGLADPMAIQKLVRHFAKDAGVKVRLDYADDAVPRTGIDETDGRMSVTIPAWIKTDDLFRLLAAVLHESGHALWDRAGMEAMTALLRKETLPSWAMYLLNVVMDARIDVRRCDTLAGAPMLYRACWQSADAHWRDTIPKMGADGAEAVRVHLTALGALAAVGGFESAAPIIAAGPFATHPKRTEIADLLRGCVDEDGTLLPEAFRLLALLALDGRPTDQSTVGPTPAAAGPTQPSPDAQDRGGESGEGGDRSGSAMSSPPDPVSAPASASGSAESESDALAAFERDTDALCRRRSGLKAALRDPVFRDRLRRAANRVFRGQLIKIVLEGSGGAGGWVTDAMKAAIKALGGGEDGALFHTSPATFGEAITPFDKAEIRRAREDYIGEAIRAFVAATVETVGDDDYRYRLDDGRLATLLADPLDVLVGDTVKPAAHAAIDVVLDVSGSMRGAMSQRDGTSRMDALVSAVAVWLDGLDGLAISGVTMGVRLFATGTARHLDFTDVSGIAPTAVLGRALWQTASGKGVGGGTNAREGLEASIADLQTQAARRKAILLVTDGDITPDDYAWMQREWPEEIGLAVLAVSEDAGGFAASGEGPFRWRATTADEVAPMLATAIRESVESQGRRG